MKEKKLPTWEKKCHTKRNHADAKFFYMFICFQWVHFFRFLVTVLWTTRIWSCGIKQMSFLNCLTFQSIPILYSIMQINLLSEKYFQYNITSAAQGNTDVQVKEVWYNLSPQQYFILLGYFLPYFAFQPPSNTNFTCQPYQTHMHKRTHTHARARSVIYAHTHITNTSHLVVKSSVLADKTLIRQSDPMS